MKGVCHCWGRLAIKHPDGDTTSGEMFFVPLYSLYSVEPYTSKGSMVCSGLGRELRITSMTPPLDGTWGRISWVWDRAPGRTGLTYVSGLQRTQVFGVWFTWLDEETPTIVPQKDRPLGPQPHMLLAKGFPAILSGQKKTDSHDHTDHYSQLVNFMPRPISRLSNFLQELNSGHRFIIFVTSNSIFHRLYFRLLRNKLFPDGCIKSSF